MKRWIVAEIKTLSQEGFVKCVMYCAGNNSLGCPSPSEINNDVFFCLPLVRLLSALIAKNPHFVNLYGVILHHDNAIRILLSIHVKK